MSKFVKLLVAAAAGLSLQANAALLIDDFSDGQFVFDRSTAGGGDWSQSAQSANILGGYREIFVQKTAGPNATNPSDFTKDVTASADNGTFSMNTPTGINGKTTIRWDGAATLGQSANAGGGFDFNLANINTSTIIGDLTAYGNALFFKYSADHDAQIKIEAWSTGGGYSSLTDILFNTLVNGQSTEQSGFVPLALLAGTVDFTKLTALQVTFNGDSAVTELDLSFTPATVPEPASIAVAGLALLALSASRRRKN